MIESILYRVTAEAWEAFRERHVTIYHVGDGGAGWYHVHAGHAHGCFDSADSALGWGDKQIPRVKAQEVSEWRETAPGHLPPMDVPTVIEAEVMPTDDPDNAIRLHLRDLLIEYVEESLDESAALRPFHCKVERSADVVQFVYSFAGHELARVVISPI